MIAQEIPRAHQQTVERDEALLDKVSSTLLGEGNEQIPKRLGQFPVYPEKAASDAADSLQLFTVLFGPISGAAESFLGEPALLFVKFPRRNLAVFQGSLQNRQGVTGEDVDLVVIVRVAFDQLVCFPFPIR